MPGIESDTEERIARGAGRRWPGVRRRPGRRGVPRTIRRRPRSRGRRDVRRSRRCPRATPAASSTTNPARQFSAPQIPNAIVNGSPRSIGRSPGLSSPYRARGPALSIRWHDSGAPFHPSSRAASRSVMPGCSPVSTLRTLREVWHAAHSNAASCSTSLITRSPSAALMSRSVAFSTSPRRADGRPELVDEERRRLDRRAARVRLPTDDSDPTAGLDALVAQGLGERPRVVPRLARQAQVLEADRPHGEWRRRAEVEALVAEQERRITGRRDDQHRFFESRVEPGEVGDVGAVLAVGPHDDVVVAAGVHDGPQPFQSIGEDRRRQQRFRRRHPEIRQRDLRQTCSRFASRRHSPGCHGVASVVPRSIVTNWSAPTVIHGPVSPSGHWTRTSASSASPRPAWIQPLLPPA